MRTADSVPPSLTGRDVLISLAACMVVYLVVFPAGAIVMARIVRMGPASPDEADAAIESGRPAAPITVQIGAAGPIP
jgi:cytochrome d ubiquinol oxidase subunit I